jgi:TolB-like protein/DNA-binding winged helix-turn-helix (wHTH) protein/Tfp pilus assembly protein PilF
METRIYSLPMNTPLPTKKSIYHFDGITIDRSNFRVFKNGRDITLTPRAFDVLVLLLENSGRAVEKREIFEVVWEETFVSDNALTKIIKEIRQAIGDDANNARYIETIPKRGYRFIGNLLTDEETQLDESQQIGDEIVEDYENQKSNEPVSIIEQPKKFSKAALSKSVLRILIVFLILVSAFTAWFLYSSKFPENSPSHPRSIAVLPFKPLNSESRDESLEMGMAETLITRLSNLKEITVRPMSAVRKYTDLQQDSIKAGQEVQTEAVLDGSIQKTDERVRITVRLIKVETGTTLWSEQFDEKFTDIFKVQDSIAERITEALTLRLSNREKELLAKNYTENTEAYQLYLRGQLYWNSRRQNWIEQSLSYYQQALEKDPNFALAYIGMADCYIMMSGHRRISMQAAEAKARPAIMKALEIDDSLALAHNALAELKYQFEYDWTGAEKEFKKAIELNPNSAWIRQAYGWFLMTEARFEEAAVEMDKAQELDPSSLTIKVGRGRLYYYSRQYDQAIRYLQNLIAVEPNDSSLYIALADAYEQKQMYHEAIETHLKFQQLKGLPSEKADEMREFFNSSGWQGVLRKKLADLEKRKSQNRNPSASEIANLYVRLGEKDKAFALFEKVFEKREPLFLQFKVEPAYDILRDDPRYDELLRRINLKR